MSHAFVLGATSTLGQSLVRLLARDGMNLTLTGRNTVQLERMRVDLAARYRVNVAIVTLDLLQEFDAEDVLNRAEQAELVTHFFSLPGVLGEDVAAVTQVNYTAPAQFIAAAAARMEMRGTGTVVVITSVAGDRGRGSNYVYGAAKAALSTFTDGLRHKLQPKIHVMTVKPGFIATPMTNNMNSPLIASPEKVAALIVKAMKKRRGMVYVPWFWWGIMLIIRHLPTPIFNRLKL